MLLLILLKNVGNSQDVFLLILGIVKVDHFVCLHATLWLGIYFSLCRFKWSLFKTLEFLNSRKEDVELEPAFFEQLTAFAQKLQDKGLIRSKTWVISPGMSDEEIVITNTYLNSKNKFGTASPHPSSMNRMKNKNTVNWKK